jgi:hypothetical protein
MPRRGIRAFIALLIGFALLLLAYDTRQSAGDANDIAQYIEGTFWAVILIGIGIMAYISTADD